jgi:hypothetical protein
MKRVIPFLVIVVTGCAYQTPIVTTQPRNNTDYQVSYLFEHGGCKVYRFYDYGHTVYFTNCSGDTTAFTDSTVVRSSSLFNKPVNISTYTRTKDSGYYRYRPKIVDQSSFKENR